MDHFDHWSVEPYCRLNIIFYTASVAYFLDDTRSVNVTSFKRVDVNFTILVDELCTKRANLFCNKLTEDLCWVCSTCRVILERILIKELCTCAVCHNKTVSCCTVVVRCWESLIVHASSSTSCDDYNLCLCNANFTSFNVFKNSTTNFSLVILDEFNCSCKVYNCNLVWAVENFVTECAHDFST